MDILAIFAPLFGFLIAFLFGKQIGDKGAMFVTCAGVIIAALSSFVLFQQVILESAPYTKVLSEWIVSGDFAVNWALRFDQLSVVMMLVVNIVSSCVHVYSIGYMSHDPHRARFFAYLSLFTFAMLMLVSADNLLQLFFGWEGVGLTSYLLIGFWNKKHTANSAANKAFIVNRVGDFGFLLGIFAVFMLFGSVDFDTIFELAPDYANATFEFIGYTVPALTTIGLLLFLGAVGKSAQVGLHTWLPDAMEGPTPVSALIHAATMVTAGVFLVARFSPLYEYAPLALMVICVVGALTAFVAATIGMTQFDIKRVIAYSTMSQLGYMFFALGVSAYGAAMFHLFTHAFFKALLFLGAGSVIHAMSDEQDMRRMGGIWKLIPTTYVLMWIGALALAGIPFFAGFYSKDMILEAAWADHTWFGTFAYWLGIAAAFMTAFYSWRLILMTFHGPQRADEKVMAHVHESPSVMLMPLAVLAVGAIMAGSSFYGGFVGSPSDEVIMRDGKPYVSAWHREYFWGESLKVLPENDTVEGAYHVPKWVKYLPVVVGVLGILTAYLLYLWRAGIVSRLTSLPLIRQLNALFFRKWYFDELYESLFVKTSFFAGMAFSGTGDRKVIDRFGPDGFAWLSQRLGAGAGKAQSGYIYHYAFVMIVSVIGIISFILLFGER